MSVLTTRAPIRRTEPLRMVLAALASFAGVSAIWGGLELVMRPDGKAIGLPLGLLEHTPFPDFFVPGLLLAGAVGLSNAVAGALVVHRHPLANRAALVSGAGMAIWIVVEVLLLRGVHWLHAVYLAVGLGTLGAACARERRAGTLEPTVRAFGRVLVHASAGWAVCAATMAFLLAAAPLPRALLVHALFAPLVFAFVSWSYFRRPSAWTPLPAAIAFVGITALLDLVVVACFVQRSLDMFRSPAGTWLPLALVFVATWVTGKASTRAAG